MMKTCEARQVSQSSHAHAGTSRLGITVNVPYYVKDADSMIFALREVLQLDPAHIVVVYDIKGEQCKEVAYAAQRAVLAELDRQSVVFEILGADSSDTTFRWRSGVVRLLESQDIDAVLVFPGDITVVAAQDMATFHDGCRRMAQLAGAKTLVIGDYTCKDWYKEDFDERITLPLIRVLYPQLVEKVMKLNHSKLRTEFLCVGRDIFEYFEKTQQLAWNSDCTVQLILAALQTGDLEVLSVNLGHLCDAPTRNPLVQLHQIIRFAFQEMNDRLRSEINATYATNRSKPLQLAAYDALNSSFAAVFEEITRIAHENRKKFILVEELSSSLAGNVSGRYVPSPEAQADRRDQVGATPEV